MKTRAVLYARVSGDDHDEASKLDAQISMCREYAGKQDYTILHEFQEDEYSSGADWDLPGLNEFLRMASDGEFDVLVCRDMDRLARGIKTQWHVEEELEKTGVRIEYVLEDYADTPEGHLFKGIKAQIAEYEREKTRWRTMTGKRNKARAGNVFCNGVPPYGYSEATVDGRRTLEIVPEDAAVVGEIFDLYLNGGGMGVKAIAAHLTDKRVPTVGDTRRNVLAKTVAPRYCWHRSTVSRMLRCSVYRGKWIFAKNDGDPIEVEVPAIVPNDVWKAAQTRMDAKRRHRPSAGDYTFLLRDMAYCSECGAPMRCKTHRRNKIWHYYKCGKAHDDPVYRAKCSHSLYHRADVIDVELWKEVKTLVSDPDRLRRAFQKYRSSLRSDDNPVRDKLENKQKLISSTERELSNLIHLYMKEKITEEQYDEERKPLDIQLKQHTEDADALSQELEQSTKLEEHMHTTGRFVATATQALKAANKDDGAKRRFLQRLGVGAAMSYDRSSKYVDWFIFAPDELSVRDLKQRSVSGDTWLVANSSPVVGSAFMLHLQPAPYGGAYVVHKLGDGEV